MGITNPMSIAYRISHIAYRMWDFNTPLFPFFRTKEKLKLFTTDTDRPLLFGRPDKPLLFGRPDVPLLCGRPDSTAWLSPSSLFL